MLLYNTQQVYNFYTSVENPPADGATSYLFIYWDIKALTYFSNWYI